MKKNITFIVTKDCQLACKYCYLIGKNTSERMSWPVAKKAIDYILQNEKDDFFNTDGVNVDFIGGEPLLEVELIDKICSYWVERMDELNHHWKNSCFFSITTNGINYNSEKVQKLIEHHGSHLGISITIDGTKRKHDMNRVWKTADANGDERGSYDDVIKNLPIWREQYSLEGTKVTFSSKDLPYLAESILHLFSLGIPKVYSNCVFEDAWMEGDDIILEGQLKSLADTMLLERLYEKHECTFFDRSIGQPMAAGDDGNWCGAGRMLAIDAAGMFYPCTRFAQFSLREKEARYIGNVNNGLDKNLIRPYYYLRRSVQSPMDCLECDVAKGCAWCQGENYDCSDTNTIFQRSVAICKMHKARVRANNYYWTKLDELLENDEVKPSHVDRTCLLDKTVDKLECVLVLLSEDSTPFCILSNPNNAKKIIPYDYLEKVVAFAKSEGLKLQFVYPSHELPNEYRKLVDSVEHMSIVPVGTNIPGNVIVVNGWEEIKQITAEDAYYIFRTSLKDFYGNVDALKPLLRTASQLNIIFVDEADFKDDDESLYETTLNKLKDMLLEEWQNGRQVKLNLITDRLFLDEMSNCNAGCKSVTFAPNGRYYICPSFYYENPNNNCGDVESGLDIKNPLLYKLNHSPVCVDCKAYHCQRCIFLNKTKTLEVNIPSFEQCEKSRIELEVTNCFFEQWNNLKPDIS